MCAGNLHKMLLLIIIHQTGGPMIKMYRFGNKLLMLELLKCIRLLPQLILKILLIVLNSFGCRRQTFLSSCYIAKSPIGDKYFNLLPSLKIYLWSLVLAEVYKQES